MIPPAILSACASYEPKPLNDDPVSIHELAALPGAQQGPLTIDEVVTLAVNNNPDLIAARTKRGVAQAQLQSAGILPNPVLSLSYADVQSGPGTVAALGAGIMQDVRAFITRGPNREAAANAARAVDANVLWEEWQLAGKARLLAVDIVQGNQQLALLIANADLADERLAKTRRATERGDETLVSLAPDITAAADAYKAFDDADRAQQTRRRDLATLLGLASDTPLSLSSQLALPQVDPAAIEGRLDDLPRFRPDLAALQFGYASEEAKLRGAILLQFPAFSLGVAAARDTSNVRTLGPQATIDLPLFDRGQGKLSEETATRDQLHAEYSARLHAARAEVESLLADQRLLFEQLTSKRAQLRQMEMPAHLAEAAVHAGDIDTRTYVDLLTSRNSKQQEALAAETLLLEQQVALATLVGAGLRPLVLESADSSHD